MKSSYRHMMEQITMDDQAREEIMAQLEGGSGAKATKRHAHPLRTGVLAACVCLVVAGSVFAGQELLGARFQGADQNNYKVSVGGLITFPQEQFSPQMVQDMADVAAADPSGQLCRDFNTWQEVEDYLGLPMADNPVLAASARPIYTTNSDEMLGGDREWNDGEDPSEKSQYLYSMDTWLWGGDMLTCDIRGFSQLDGTNVGLMVTLWGEGDEAPPASFSFSGYHDGENEYSAQEYAMKNGCPAQLIYRYAGKDAGAPVECTAYFGWNGARCRVHFTCPEGQSVDPAVVERVMDAFE